MKNRCAPTHILTCQPGSASSANGQDARVLQCPEGGGARSLVLRHAGHCGAGCKRHDPAAHTRGKGPQARALEGFLLWEPWPKAWGLGHGPRKHGGPRAATRCATACPALRCHLCRLCLRRQCPWPCPPPTVQPARCRRAMRERGGRKGEGARAAATAAARGSSLCRTCWASCRAALNSGWTPSVLITATCTGTARHARSAMHWASSLRLWLAHGGRALLQPSRLASAAWALLHGAGLVACPCLLLSASPHSCSSGRRRPAGSEEGLLGLGLWVVVCACVKGKKERGREKGNEGAAAGSVGGGVQEAKP